MLRLRVAPADAADAPPQLDEGAGVEVWRHHDGTVTAYGAVLGGEHVLRIPHIGSFRIRQGSEQVAAYPEEGVPRPAVEDAFRRAVLPLALQALGREVLHASAVRGPNGIAALCAVSETGKSTLAYGLARRGYDLWADDAVAFELTAEGARALPVPFVIRLRTPSAEFFDVDREYEVIEPEEAAPLAALYVLEREGSADAPPVAVERVTSAEALTVVLGHAYHFTLADPERKRRMLETYLELVAHVPIHVVRLRAGLELLPEILDELDAALR